MRIIITGGTGLIGSALAHSLNQDAHEVIVLSRAARRPAGLDAGISVVQWDGRSASGWGELVNGDTAIVNLAGANIAAGRWSDARKHQIVTSRVQAGQAVVQAVQQAAVKPQVVIQSSAVGYYGPCGDEVISEASPSGNDFLAEVCRQWEASTVAVEALGVRRAVIRTGVVLSERGGALPRMALLFRLFVGGKLGSGRQYFPWIHLNDEVGAIRFLLEQPAASGIFNLAAPKPPTNAQFTQALGKALGRPTFMPVPAFALRTLFGEMATVLLDGQRAVPQRLEQAGYTFRFTDAVTALKDLLR
ncbi:MAG: TIGR01777 family oxidoreductase [Caldilineales bacterium]